MFKAVVLLTIISFVALLLVILVKDWRSKIGVALTGAMFATSLAAVFIIGDPPTETPAETPANLEEENDVYSYEELQNGTIKEGTMVEVKGEAVSSGNETIPDGYVFTLKTPKGGYHVLNSAGKEISNGESITIRGIYNGPAYNDFPAINAQSIE
ncbi:hypothetical protein [Planococcus lenghuensis]|uniref:Uncharacterized protein n=1 Tax=Planococcus lenghuensis TaxID=2213202 RepID=A0A1Q2KZA1_9BACL|nr:hypothetical protein [Planococcus lenghuensis]AQQ53528.1 hypothetical protein B0X71_10895 [Planococcus lenghuensis]